MKKRFLVLWSAGVVSTALALPYILTLQQSVVEQTELPLWVLVLISLAQSALLLAVAVFFGLKLANRIGVAVWVPGADESLPGVSLKDILRLAVPLGVVVALAIALGNLFFAPFIPELMAASEQMAFWKALLVAPYGGVVEELLMRLFLLSLIAYLLGAVFRIQKVAQHSPVMWTAIVGATLVFGIGHLPATASIVVLTPLVVARALVLNGIGGIVFGWLYWKRGLVYAVVAHFTADIVLHALLPLL